MLVQFLIPAGKQAGGRASAGQGKQAETNSHAPVSLPARQRDLRRPHFNGPSAAVPIAIMMFLRRKAIGPGLVAQCHELLDLRIGPA